MHIQFTNTMHNIPVNYYDGTNAAQCTNYKFICKKPNILNGDANEYKREREKKRRISEDKAFFF